jgi:uncharacterized caspase-like protein
MLQRALGLLGIFALMLITVADAHAERRVALVVGNAHYVHANVLRNPDNDAKDIGALLKQLGFDVVVATDLDQQAFARAIDDFGRRVQGADVGLFFYAGHGLQMNGKNYLVSTSAELENEFLIPAETMRLGTIIQLMESRTKVNLVFLDACRDNPLADRLRQSLVVENRSIMLGRGLARVQPTGQDTLIAYAAAPGQTAADGRGRNSPFSHALLQHMAEPGVEVSVMLKEVAAEVRRETNGEQRPQQLSDMSETFYFAKAEPAVTKAQPAAKSASLPPEPLPNREAKPAARPTSADLTHFATPSSFAHPQDTGLARGDAVVTGFSGIKPLDVPLPPGANPLDYFVIDLQGPSAEILSLSGLGNGPHGQLAPTPVKRQITAGQVGQVFAVTLDDGLGQDVPNIYLGATSVYGVRIVGPDTDGDGHPNRLKTGQPGAQFMVGQFGPAPDGKPGTIWRVDGTSGAVSAFATLPGNSGPGVGDFAFDKTNKQFFASDLDNGLIYRISSDGHVLNSFDHGVSGRPAKGLAPLPDNGKVMDITSPSFDSQNPATWGYTQKDRMVWGMCVHDGRLYYAVADQIWSIGIGTDGDFAGDPRWELDATALPGDGPSTDMLFDKQGRMYLAQRGKQRGSYDYSVYAEPGKSSVVRYSLESPDDPITPSVWAPDADEYAIGMRPESRFADGGIALGYAHDEDTGALQPGTCDTMLWSTGTRLRSSENPDTVDDGTGEPDVHGLQGNDTSLVRPQDVPPSQAYYIDYDGLFGDAAKSGHIGDVAIWQPCDHQAFEEPGEMLPGYFAPGGELPPIESGGLEYPWHNNLRIHKHAKKCIPYSGGWSCPYVISVKNTGPDPYFGPIAVDDAVPPIPGSVAWAGPPWVCGFGGVPPHLTCHSSATFLPVNGKVHLYMVKWVSDTQLAPGKCHLHNVTKIEFPVGGSRQNTDPTDDTDSATAAIPSPKCKPTNLKLTKKAAGPCTISAGGAVCKFKVTVQNMGPGAFSGTINVNDTPTAGTSVAASGLPWTCAPTLLPGGPTATCHSTVTLSLLGSKAFTSIVTVPKAVAIANGCKIANSAKILTPLGAPDNTVGTDDSYTAPAIVPASMCSGGSSGPSTYTPPPPPKNCPPGYQFEKGACKLKPRSGSPLHLKPCPERMVGKWPNCHPLVGCKYGGRFPHCNPKPQPKIGCKFGGRWPHCHRNPQVQSCPIGTIGQWPQCRRINLQRSPPSQKRHQQRPLVRLPYGHGHFALPLNHK